MAFLFPKTKKFIEHLLFGTRYILILFYFGLIIWLLKYEWIYAKEILHTIGNDVDKNQAMLILLELVDMVMVANLVKMIITGSYNSFVSKLHDYTNENISSGMLKVKMSTSLIGVSAIHLLQTFLSDNWTWVELNKQLVIHGVFIIGSLVLSVIDYIHIKTESIDNKTIDNH